MILAFDGEAIFAVANFKEEGPTKQQKEKKAIEKAWAKTITAKVF